MAGIARFESGSVVDTHRISFCLFSLALRSTDQTIPLSADFRDILPLRFHEFADMGFRHRQRYHQNLLSSGARPISAALNLGGGGETPSGSAP